MREIRDVESSLHAHLGRRPTNAEVADALGWAPLDVDHVLEGRRRSYQVSLDAPVGATARSRDLPDEAADGGTDPVRRYEAVERHDGVEQLLSSLPERPAPSSRSTTSTGRPSARSPTGSGSPRAVCARSTRTRCGGCGRRPRS
jgi:hypothetical protein